MRPTRLYIVGNVSVCGMAFLPASGVSVGMSGPRNGTSIARLRPISRPVWTGATWRWPSLSSDPGHQDFQYEVDSDLGLLEKRPEGRWPRTVLKVSKHPPPESFLPGMD